VQCRFTYLGYYPLLYIVAVPTYLLVGYLVYTRLILRFPLHHVVDWVVALHTQLHTPHAVAWTVWFPVILAGLCRLLYAFTFTLYYVVTALALAPYLRSQFYTCCLVLHTRWV